MDVLAISATVIAFIALVFAYSLSSWIGKIDEGTDRMKEISGYIKEGAMTFLKREYKAMVLVIPVLFIILGFTINWTTAVLYVIGALFSVLAGFFGMRTAAKGNARTVNAAMCGGMNQALKTAFRSGAVVGLCTMGLGLLGIGGVFVVLGIKSASVITGFGLGASTMALFGRVVGGIYSKAADVGVDLIKKTETGISEDDLRNSAVIADHVGNLADDVAGMGSDLFESFVGSIIAVITIAMVTKSIDPTFGYPFDLPALEGSVFPLILPAAGIIASIAGIMFVRGNDKSDPAAALNAGKYLCNCLVVIFSIILSWAFFGNFNCAAAIIIGMLIGALFSKITGAYASDNSHHLRKIAEQSQTGHSMVNVYEIGMLSTLWPIIILIIGVLAANAFAGFYGIALAAVGMLSTTGMAAAIDAYCPVSNHAAGIARMAYLSEEVRTIAGKLDSVGKANAEKGKGFAIGAAAMTALALFASYSTIVELKTINLLKPMVIAGLFLGAMLPFIFSAMTLSSAGKVVTKMIEEVRNQLHSDAGVLAGTTKPDYEKCVDSGTKAALKELAAPGLLAIAAPLAVGIIMGTEALGGMLAGSLTSGVLAAMMMVNANGAWDHGKKYSAGNPLKDTTGLTVNILIKLMAITAVVFAPIFVSIGGLL